MICARTIPGKIKAIQFSLVVVALLSIWSNSIAAPVVPGSADVGRAIEENESRPKPVYPGGTSVVAPEEKTNPAPAGADKVTFTLHHVIIEGSTVYKYDDLLALYNGYIDKTVSLQQIYDLANLLTKRYHDDGYALSKAVVPPQEINNGDIRISVIEGYVDTMTIQGAYHETEMTDAMFDKITSEVPLNIKTLEHQMLLYNDLAGTSAQAILKEADDKSAVGATHLVLVFNEVNEPSTISYDNFGSRYLGPYEASFQTGFNILPYERTTINGLATTPTKELKFIDVTHTVPVDSSGTTATMGFSYGHSNPGYTLEADDIKSNAHDYSIGLTQPVIRSRVENLYFGTGFEFKNNYTDVLSNRLYADALRIVNVSGNYDRSDSWKGTNQLQIKLSQGLDILGASRNGSLFLSRQNGHSDFTKINVDANRLQNVANDVNVYVAGTAQYAGSALLSSEQFGFGGEQFGRAYDTSEITGDDGIAGSVELQYSGLPDIWNTPSQLFTFYDIGKVWNYDGADISASSTGVGLRLVHDERLSANLTLAEPLTKRVDAPEYGGGKDPRVFFSVSYKLR